MYVYVDVYVYVYVHGNGLTAVYGDVDVDVYVDGTDSNGFERIRTDSNGFERIRTDKHRTRTRRDETAVTVHVDCCGTDVDGTVRKRAPVAPVSLLSASNVPIAMV